MMKRKSGSILMYVMVIFAVLMIMGSTLTMLSLQNIKSRRFYANSRRNQYFTESGIEEVYGVLKSYTEKGNDFALTRTDDDIQGMVQEDFVLLGKIEDKKKNGDSVESLIAQLKIYDYKGELDTQKLSGYQKNLYEGYYKDYFHNIKDGRTNLEWLLRDIENWKYLSEEEDRVQVSVENKEELDSFYDGMTMNIKSIFSRNNVEKEIKVQYSLTIPKYNSRKSFPERYVEIYLNPAMDKGLVVDGIVELQGVVNVVGDIYAKGKNDKSIVFSGEKAQVNIVDGSAILPEGVLFDYNYRCDNSVEKEHRARLNIDRNLYTKNILFKRDRDESGNLLYGSQGAGLIVNGGAYVKDDLQIDSDRVSIDVGSYYGVSDGSVSPENKMDNSSSIIVNSSQVRDEETEVFIDKVLLAGTSYIKDIKDPAGENEFFYQTGESISVKGNYVAYNEVFKESHIVQVEDEGHIVNRDIKYELRNTFLSPLSLGTHFDPYSRWFTLYGGDEKYLVVGLKKEFHKKYPLAKKFRIGGKSFVGVLGKRERIESEIFDSIEDDSWIDVELLSEDERYIDSIKFKQIKKEADAYFYNGDLGKYVRVDLTPRGELDESFRGVIKFSTNVNEEELEQGYFKEMLKVDSSVSQGDSIEISFFNRFGEVIQKESVQLKNYEDMFYSLDGRMKNNIFEAWHGENTQGDRIRGQSGIEINRLQESVYTGAVVFKDREGNYRVEGGNYYDSPENEKKIGYREDILKDKIYYMDSFEKKFYGRERNPYEDKEIEDFSSYREYYNVVDIGEESPRGENEYVLHPRKFVDVSRGASHNIDKLNETGLYVNYTSNGVLLTDNGLGEINGVKFKGDILNLQGGESGIIVVKDDLYIQGHVKFYGLVVVMGNVYVEEDAEINIIYDKETVAKVAALEREAIEEIFIEDITYRGDKVAVKSQKSVKEENRSVPIKLKKWVVVR